MLIKLFWMLRGLCYKFIFGKFIMPSYIGKPIFIGNFKRIFIGKRVRILPNSRIEVVDEKSSIVFENNISIAQNLHIISGGEQELRIGKNTTFSANVFVTNIDHSYQDIDVHIMEQAIVKQKTEIGENCFIGYGAVIQAGTKLGKQCVVGANSVVRGTFPDYSVIVGAPARIVKRYDLKEKIWKKTDKNGNFLSNYNDNKI